MEREMRRAISITCNYLNRCWLISSLILLVQLYQFDVTLIVKCARFKKHIMQMNTVLRWRNDDDERLLTISVRSLCAIKRIAAHNDFEIIRRKALWCRKLNHAFHIMRNYSMFGLCIFFVCLFRFSASILSLSNNNEIVMNHDTRKHTMNATSNCKLTPMEQ